jgi:hypothetical protein
VGSLPFWWSKMVLWMITDDIIKRAGEEFWRYYFT